MSQTRIIAADPFEIPPEQRAAADSTAFFTVEEVQPASAAEDWRMELAAHIGIVLWGAFIGWLAAEWMFG